VLHHRKERGKVWGPIRGERVVKKISKVEKRIGIKTQFKKKKKTRMDEKLSEGKKTMRQYCLAG